MSSKIQTVIHTSKPDRNGKGGGVEYIELSGAGINAMLATKGINAVFEAAGLKVPDAARVFFSTEGYGEARQHVLRVNRAEYEGTKPASAPRQQAAKPAYNPGGASTPKAPVAGPGLSLSDKGKRALSVLQEKVKGKEARLAHVAEWLKAKKLSGEDAKLLRAAVNAMEDQGEDDFDVKVA
jgi:hypothetical protein